MPTTHTTAQPGTAAAPPEQPGPQGQSGTDSVDASDPSHSSDSHSSDIPDTTGLDAQARMNKALEFIGESVTASDSPIEESDDVVVDPKVVVKATEPVKAETTATEKFLSRLEAAKTQREIKERTKSASKETDSLKSEVATLKAQLDSILTNPSEALLKLGKDPVAYVDRIANFKPESVEEKAVRERREYDESLQREIQSLKEQLNGIHQSGQTSQERAVREQFIKQIDLVDDGGALRFPHAYSEMSPDQVYLRAVEMAKEVRGLNTERLARGEEQLFYEDHEFLAAVDQEAKQIYVDRENRRKKAFGHSASDEEDSESEVRVGRSSTKARTNITSAVASQRSAKRNMTMAEREHEALKHLGTLGYR